MASKSKSGKDGETTSSSVTKGEVITVRLSPKLKYALELLSRTQHRTQSAVVTWAIQEAINTDHGLLKTNIRGTKISVDNMLEVLWAVHPADRLVKLAKHWPELMTYEEELRHRNPGLWWVTAWQHPMRSPRPGTRWMAART